MKWKSLPKIATIFMILITASYLVSETLKQPYIGIAIQETSEKSWQVVDIDLIGWASHHGIKVEDIVLTVNKREPGQFFWYSD